MLIKNISDDDFVAAHLSFNRHARPSINFLLEELIVNDTKSKSGEKGAIYLQILENYLLITESILMFLTAFHQKKVHPQRSLASIFSKTFIREGKEYEDSKKMLEYLTSHSDQEVLSYLGLKDPGALFDSSHADSKMKALAVWGSEKAVYEQAKSEIKHLRESLIIILHNRVFDKENIDTPFYKVLNKLKHGYQVIPDKSTDSFDILIEVVKEEKDQTEFEIITIPFSIESAKWFSQQSRIMQNVIEHLLMFYSFNL